MAKSPAKYVVIKNGCDLLFQRRLPTKLLNKLNITKGKMFLRSMGLVCGCSAAELNKALAHSHTLYEMYCQRLENSSPEAFTDNELEVQVVELARKLNIKPSQLVNSKDKAGEINKALWGYDDGQIEAMETYDNLAKDTEVDNLTRAQASFASEQIASEAKRTIAQRDFNKTMQLRLADKLIEAKKFKPKTLGALVKEYFYAKGFEDKNKIADEPNVNKRTRRSNAKRIKRIKRYLDFVGDQYVTKELEDTLQVALDNYCYERLNSNTVTISTVQRELADINSFINHSNKKYKYNWNITSPDLEEMAGSKVPRSKKRKPLTADEQVKLVDYILNTKHNDHVAGVMLLLYLQAGVMPSEVEHMTLENGSLGDAESATPYLNANYDITKTDARKRLVPIVIGAKYIRQHLEETTNWLKRVTESSSSFKNTKFLRKATENDTVTGHCLRHTYRYNFLINDANVMHCCLIAGWDVKQFGHSRDGADYALALLEDPAVVRRLYETQKVMHQHLEQFFE